MEKIRLPEDFTERVMQKIEQRERTAARKMRILTVTGGLDYFNISLSTMTGDLHKFDITGTLSGFISGISSLMREVLSAPANPLFGIVFAVFIIACAGLWHDRRNSFCSE